MIGGSPDSFGAEATDGTEKGGRKGDEVGSTYNAWKWIVAKVEGNSFDGAAPGDFGPERKDGIDDEKIGTIEGSGEQFLNLGSAPANQFIHLGEEDVLLAVTTNRAHGFSHHILVTPGRDGEEGDGEFLSQVLEGRSSEQKDLVSAPVKFLEEDGGRKGVSGRTVGNGDDLHLATREGFEVKDLERGAGWSGRADEAQEMAG